MIDIKQIRTQPIVTISLGSHPGIIQSMLDYEYLIGREKASVVAIVSKGRLQERYFWGHDEIVVPVIASLSELDAVTRASITVALNVQSARRVLSSTVEAFGLLPSLFLLNIFAEQTPELHALEIEKEARSRNVTVIGPSSVGMIVPGFMKVGAIAGTQYQQLVDAKIVSGGETAVISTSGGIVNELIHTVTGQGLGISFALALGGDRYPATSATDAFLAAQNDEQTKQIVYFGELGGRDEYMVARLISEGIVTKPIVAYIAGVVAELFDEPPQFGHAKALAGNGDESATAKKRALELAGVRVCDTFGGIAIALSASGLSMQDSSTVRPIGVRKKGLIVSHLSGDVGGDVHLLGKPLLITVENNTLASLVVSMLIGSPVQSKKITDLIDIAMKLLVDHGPYVSGAVNTIVSARAGKDLVSSLASGLLTIGPRFGGAINQAASNWLEAIRNGYTPRQFVELLTERDGVIAGIGHKKYRIDMPDPRVSKLLQYSDGHQDPYLTFAREVAAITSSKKANLILNVDGTIAAILLDLLASELGYDDKKLQELVDIEFFNALFVLSRAIGFTGHYLDQRRHDEGLLRLSTDEIRYIE